MTRGLKPAVLMIAYTNYPTDGRVIREAEAAVAAGFEVDFLALRRGDEPEIENINGVRLIHLNQCRYRGTGLGSYVLGYVVFFLRCFLKATLLFFKRRYRVIHVNNMPDALVFSALIPKLFGAKIILDIHDPMPNTFASKFKKPDAGLLFRFLLWQERCSARFADRVLTVHDPVKDFVLVKHGLKSESIQVIANFADERLFTVSEPYHINGKLRLVFHGTILERYGLRQLATALSQVRHRDKIDVKIIGEGDFSNSLKELISSLRLGDIVRFENRMLPFHQIPEFLRECNVGLAPLEISSITNYALPLKLLEYISMGLPVITVKSAAIGCYFGDEDCFFYQPDNPETLALLLDRLAENTSLVLDRRQHVLGLRNKFFWGGERIKYASLLSQLAGVPQKRPKEVLEPSSLAA